MASGKRLDFLVINVVIIFAAIMLFSALSLPLIELVLPKDGKFDSEKTYWILPLVISSALVIFIGMFFKKVWMINIGFGGLFIGILLIELFIVFPFFVKVKEQAINYELCKSEPLLRLSTISCMLTGYKPVSENVVDIISFWVFILILPFAVIYSITFGLFSGMGLDRMFGDYGRPVVSILAFATALFGMRQFIGPFLIDLLAYGVWGIFGVLIACIITGALRFIMLKTFIETEEMKKSIASMFKLYEVDLFDEIDNFIRRVNSVLGKPEEIGEVSGWIERINSYISILSGIKDKTQDDKKKVKCQMYINRLEELKGALERIKKEKEKGGGRQAPSLS
ncbi:MAG: hypothetical protein QXS69_01040 [Candidatus Aenigmatarchaeota archaeon]